MSKRFRRSVCERVVELCSTGGETMEVRLSVAEPGEDCMLTLDPIADDQLDFLPGVTFEEQAPSLTKMILPCGHGFGAMNLTYYFVRRNMLCPCCRRGCPHTLATACIPVHFAERLVDRTRTERERDLEEAIQDDLASASAILAGGGRLDDGDLPLILVQDVQMSVFAHDELDKPPCIQFQFPLAMVGVVAGGDEATTVTFTMAAQDRRNLSRLLHGCGFTYLSLSTFARTITGRIVVLCNTEPFELQCHDAPSPLSAQTGASSTNAIVVESLDPQEIECGPTCFSIVRQLGTTNVVRELLWRTPVSHLLTMIELQI